MANLIRWEPFNDLVSLRDAMDHLFEDSFVRPRWITPLRDGLFGTLALDVVETDNDLVVKATVPGLKPEDLDVTITGDTLTIKGEIKAQEKDEKATYLMQERRVGALQRAITLPVEVQADKAKAEFEHGVLTLSLPKAEAIKPKSIKVVAK